VRNRLVTYHSNVDAVLGYYTDSVVEVGGGRGGYEGLWREHPPGAHSCLCTHTSIYAPGRSGSCYHPPPHPTPPHPTSHPTPHTQIDGNQSMDDVFKAIEHAIDAAAAKKAKKQ
jgi:hypothetical protein